jgi:succinyl-CoA synthetase beta subunit
MKSEIRSLLETWARAGRRMVHEADTKRILSLSGIPIPEAAPSNGQTVVKLASDRFPHKTEHGLVRLGVPANDAAAVGEAMRAKDPEGIVLVERMVEDAVAEWIVGCKHDATFGPVVLAGPGGTLVELFDEVEVRLAPTTQETARAMLDGQMGGPLLSGLRGRPPADREALAELIAGITEIFVTHGDLIEEIEVNPVMVLPKGRRCVAADALLILRPPKESLA